MKNELIKHYLFLDDERNPKDVTWIDLPLYQWTIVRSYREFVDHITQHGIPVVCSYDHDLCDEHYQEYRATHDNKVLSKGVFRYDQMKEKTGFHCAAWLANYCVDKCIPIPVYYLHTLNGIGRENMRSILENAQRVIAENAKIKI